MNDKLFRDLILPEADVMKKKTNALFMFRLFHNSLSDSAVKSILELRTIQNVYFGLIECDTSVDCSDCQIFTHTNHTRNGLNDTLHSIK